MPEQPRCFCGETAASRLHHMSRGGEWCCVSCLERMVYTLEEQVGDLNRQLDRALPPKSSVRAADPSSKRVLARFVAQAWLGGYAVDVDDGVVEFDCTEKILQMGKKAALQIRDDQYESDDLVPAEILSGHSGPFRVEVASAIRRFFAEKAGPS